MEAQSNIESPTHRLEREIGSAWKDYQDALRSNPNHIGGCCMGLQHVANPSPGSFNDTPFINVDGNRVYDRYQYFYVNDWNTCVSIMRDDRNELVGRLSKLSGRSVKGMDKNEVELLPDGSKEYNELWAVYSAARGYQENERSGVFGLLRRGIEKIAPGSVLSKQLPPFYELALRELGTSHVADDEAIKALKLVLKALEDATAELQGN